MRKPRPDSVLDALPADVQDQIYELRSASLRKLVETIEKEFGVFTSIASLSVWLRKVHAEKQTEARLDAARFAQGVEDDAVALVDKGVAAQLGQLAFDAAMPRDPFMLKSAYGLLLKRQAQDMERTRLAEAAKTSREKAVEALLADCQGNPQAKELLTQLVQILDGAPAPKGRVAN